MIVLSGPWFWLPPAWHMHFADDTHNKELHLNFYKDIPSTLLQNLHIVQAKWWHPPAIKGHSLTVHHKIIQYSSPRKRPWLRTTPPPLHPLTPTSLALSIIPLLEDLKTSLGGLPLIKNWAGARRIWSAFFRERLLGIEKGKESGSTETRGSG